jgi:hypothetical protein
VCEGYLPPPSSPPTPISDSCFQHIYISQAEFKKKHIHLVSEKLCAALTSFVEENHVDYQKEKFVAGGGFFDEADMRTRYVDKPDQLENVFKNARTVICKVRQIRLWQDPKYEAIEHRGLTR